MNNHNQYPLHPATLTFNDPNQENKFLHFYFTHYLSNMRFSMLLGILIWGLFGIIEILFYPEHLLWPILVIRYLIVWPIMAFSLISTFLKNPKKYVAFGIDIGILACAFGTIAKFIILPETFPYNPIPSLIIIFLYGYAVMRARFIHASFVGLAIIFFYGVTIFSIKKHPFELFAIDGFFLLMSNFIGMYVCRSLEKFVRFDYLYSRKLKKEKKRAEETSLQLKAEIMERCLIEEKIRHHQENLEQLVHERTQELEKTQEEMIHMLGIAAEYRDTETGRHIKRMGYYCVALAQSIGFGKNACDLLFNASQMHDIGKIGIPDKILLKPGKLTEEEWETMKQHTTIGAEILSKDKSDLLEAARTIALLHHEKWNGQGYPTGIKRENIPMLARVVCLCDVFDALTSDRPYKKAWSPEESLEEIERLSGSCFDPFLVKKFKEIFPKILKIYNDCADNGNNSKE